MMPKTAGSSDYNWSLNETDFRNVAKAFDLPEDEYREALTVAAQIIQDAAREFPPQANKKAISGISGKLRKIINRLEERPVYLRLQNSLIDFSVLRGGDKYGWYTSWYYGGKRLDKAIAGAKDLLEILAATEKYRSRAGRRTYGYYENAAAVLQDFWTDELERVAKVSGHANDSRGVKTNEFVRYVHASLQLLGEDVTEQACRTILMIVRKTDFEEW
ncbi:MAG: hypothetical protein AAF224_03330 [Pseudomonadota bacterium]